MPGDAIAKRLEPLEMTVEGLAGLPAQVASLDGRVASLERQFLQFREEVRGEFSGVRQEIANGDAALRQEIAQGDAAIRREIARLESSIREEIKVEAAGTRSQMLVLHEDVLAKIKLLKDGENENLEDGASHPFILDSFGRTVGRMDPRTEEGSRQT